MLLGSRLTPGYYRRALRAHRHPPMVVARNLGHHDTRMVELHYDHLAPSFISEAIRAHARVFHAATGTVDAVMPLKRTRQRGLPLRPCWARSRIPNPASG